MKDFLFKFDSSDQAIQFGIENGLSKIKDGQVINDLASPSHAYYIIGEHQIITDTIIDKNSEPYYSASGDGCWWILFRDLTDKIIIPDEIAPFIIWRSDSGIPRPTGDVLVPNIFWLS